MKAPRRRPARDGWKPLPKLPTAPATPEPWESPFPWDLWDGNRPDSEPPTD